MVVVGLAVIAMPVSGAHLHMCFDGSEAPTAVHLEDGGAHHADAGAGIEHEHQDTDISLTGIALVKKVDSSFDGHALITATLLFLRLPVAAPVLIPRDDASVAFTTHPADLLPPLRGPPAQAS
jgi:hypothetical protein